MNERYQQIIKAYQDSANIDWRCPICNADRNIHGVEFLDSYPVACHVAMKVRSHDHPHESWAIEKIGTSYGKPLDKLKLNNITRRLLKAIKEDNEIRNRIEKQELQEFIIDREHIGRQDVETHEFTPEIEAYILVRKIEESLRAFVPRVLQKEHGDNEDVWWVKGVPEEIRTKCAESWEKDGRNNKIYYYTYPIQLMKIMDKNWKLFEPYCQRYIESKHEFLANIQHLNSIRNEVTAHYRRDISVEELSLLQSLCETIQNIIANE
jgi:hypothetical protein